MKNLLTARKQERAAEKTHEDAKKCVRGFGAVYPKILDYLYPYDTIVDILHNASEERPDGSTTYNSPEIRKLVLTHFSNSYAATTREPRSRYTHPDEPEILQHEVVHAIVTSKAIISPKPDRITMLQLKLGIENIVLHLTAALNQVLTNGTTPEDWKTNNLQIGRNVIQALNNSNSSAIGELNVLNKKMKFKIKRGARQGDTKRLPTWDQHDHAVVLRKDGPTTSRIRSKSLLTMRPKGQPWAQPSKNWYTRGKSEHGPLSEGIVQLGAAWFAVSKMETEVEPNKYHK
uniref:Uncharacterized protein n=1 Tax=Caenorhabditis japonica TaxID=281687 RepID=A0A8R1HZK3_CAEJA